MAFAIAGVEERVAASPVHVAESGQRCSGELRDLLRTEFPGRNLLLK